MNWRRLIARDSWFGFDKLEHAAVCVGLWLAVAAAVTPLLARVLWFSAVAIAWELLQLARMLRWESKGRPQPRPIECDYFSYKDVAWDYVGAIVAAFLIAQL